MEHNEIITPATSDMQHLLEISKKQLQFSKMIAALLLVIVLCLGTAVIAIVPKLNSVLANVEEITADLSSLEPLDLESLNKTLQKLDAILGPVSKLLGSE